MRVERTQRYNHGDRLDRNAPRTGAYPELPPHVCGVQDGSLGLGTACARH